MAVIEAREATIQTAAVQIRTLTVTGRQVTLAVFRQLQAEPIEDDRGILRGEPWGKVNYHPDKCGDAKEHLHVVWQAGDELRRARVQPAEPPGSSFGDYLNRRWARWVGSDDVWLAAALLAGWRPREESIIYEGGGRVVFVKFTHPVGLIMTKAAGALLDDESNLAHFGEPTTDDDRQRVERIRGRIAAAKEQLAAPFEGDVPTLDEATRRVDEELAEQDRAHARRQANWERFQALPQLFIAV